MTLTDKCKNHPRRTATFVSSDGKGMCEECSLELQIKMTKEQIVEADKMSIWLRGRLAKYQIKIESVRKRYIRK